MASLKVAVLGVGLIGGSIGLAARARGQAQVTGWDPGWGADPHAREAALRLGAIDVAASDIVGAVDDAQIVFVAAPVGVLAETIRAALEVAGPETVVTDVGSTKRKIAEAISDPRFVAGHPLAGGELGGVEHAREDLFEDATWFLCAAWGSRAGGQPLEESRQPADRLRQGPLRELIASFGATPVEIDPGTHDRLMATVSQLPHVLANLLVGQAVAARAPRIGAEAESGAGFAHAPGGAAADGDRLEGFAAGPSFRDATRVAGSNSAIWTDIYMSNRDALVAAIDELSRGLARLRTTLEAGDEQALREWNERARAQRETLTPATDGR